MRLLSYMLLALPSRPIAENDYLLILTIPYAFLTDLHLNQLVILHSSNLSNGPEVQMSNLPCAESKRYLSMFFR